MEKSNLDHNKEYFKNLISKNIMATKTATFERVWALTIPKVKYAPYASDTLNQAMDELIIDGHMPVSFKVKKTRPIVIDESLPVFAGTDKQVAYAHKLLQAFKKRADKNSAFMDIYLKCLKLEKASEVIEVLK